MSEQPAPNPILDRYAKPQRRVKVASRRRLNTYVTGEGGPAIVLAPGMGGSTWSWVRVQGYLSRFTTVVSVDNAGFGFSDPGPLPRDTKAVVADMRAALKALNVPPPYVLVGHSAGSLDIQYFACEYPDEVAGMVFVDPSSPHQGKLLSPSEAESRKIIRRDQAMFRRFEKLAREGRLTPDTPDFERVIAAPNPKLTPALNAAIRAQQTSPGRLRTLRSTMREFNGAGSDQVLEARAGRGDPPLADLPLIVLTATLTLSAPDKPAPAEQVQAWRDMHAVIATLSTRGERRMVDSDHSIQTSNARAVNEAVEEVWRAAGGRA